MELKKLLHYFGAPPFYWTAFFGVAHNEFEEFCDVELQVDVINVELHWTL